MSELMPTDPELLVSHLSKWMLHEHARFHGLKRVPDNQKEAKQNRAAEIVKIASKNKSLRVLKAGGRPVAIAMIYPSSGPRVPKQQSLFFIYDHRSSKKATPWLKRMISELAQKAPRNTQISLAPKDEKIVGHSLTANGFNTRYEILMGDTRTALKNLKAMKAPPRDLSHLGLSLRAVTKPTQLGEIMQLQKQISLKSKRHGYFSHTADQLKKDEDEYRRIITGKMDGRMLAIYRQKKVVGLMVTGIHSEATAFERNGGFSFFFHPSIQGLGITKTGYLLLLEYLREKGIRKFYGGTSQPAIQSLGKIMKRKVQHIIYVKM